MQLAVYQIDVTQDDIDAAITARTINPGYRSHCDCPIARAASRVFGCKVSVCHDGNGVMYLNIKGAYPLPQEGQDFVADFDALNDVEPLSFDWSAV